MTQILRFLIVLGCGAVVLIAEDFWAKKAYTDWSEKDATKLLQSSPWAHDINISFGSGSENAMGGGSRNRQGGAGMEDRSMPTAGPGGGGAAGGGGGRPREGDLGEAAATLTLSIRWQSAMPVLQAMIVARLGHEKVDSEEAK